MHAGDLLTTLLADHGVRFVFGLPGGQTCALYDGVARQSNRIRHVLMRDERSCAYAADGYARVTGRVGVCDATVGPGATKLPSGLGEAHHASIPVLAIISDVAQSDPHLFDYGATSQAFPQVEMLSPLVKWAAKATRPEDLPGLTRAAFRKAVSGRPGPVVLDVPQDVFDAPIEESALELAVDPRFGAFPADRPHPDPAAVERAAAVLNRAERPAMVAGGGVTISQAYEAVRALAERADIAVATTWQGKGALAETHPLAVGLLGAMGTTAAEAVVRRADVVFLVGNKSAQNSTFSWKLPGPDQTVIHLDLDGSEIGKAFRTGVGIVADARAGLEALAAKVGRRERPVWREEIAAAKAAWAERKAEEGASAARPIAPQRVVAELQRVWADDDLLVCDASFASGWGGAYLDLPAAGRRALFPRGLAGLGWGLPAAIGARFGHTGGTVWCLAGDGGFAYATGELATLALHGIKVVSIVLNNRVLGWIKWYQRLNFEGRCVASDFPAVDFAKVGDGFGCRGVRVEDPADLADALAEAARGEESVVIDVVSDPWETPIFAYRKAAETGGSGGDARYQG